MALSVYNSAAFSTASGVGIAASATVTVRLESTGALATIYSDRDGDTPISNPLTADSVGRFVFYAEPINEGYSVRVVFGAEDHTINNVLDIVHNVLGDVVHATDYGVVANTGTDQTAALQEAVNNAYNKTLVLPPGIIDISTDGGIVQTNNVHWQGHGFSSTYIRRSFSPSAASPSADDIGAINLGTNLGTTFSDLQILSASGTSGGCLVSGVSTSGNPGGFVTFRNVVLTYGAADTYKYALYFDGSANTSAPIGYRDVDLVNTYVFGGTDGSVYAKGVVQLSWHGGGAYQGSSTTGDVVLTGDATVKTQNVSISVPFLYGMTLDYCIRGVVQTGLLGSITNTSNTDGMVVLYGDKTGTIETDWTNSLAIGDGQVTFPATQNASSDVNTLDDYEEGTWTPAFTFTTPGDLSVAYTTQAGSYTKIGNRVLLSFRILTSSFTHTTASGAARITGIPFACVSASINYVGSMGWRGITKANYTDVNPYVSNNSSVILLHASGSGQATADVDAADMPTGGLVFLEGTITYRTAT